MRNENGVPSRKFRRRRQPFVGRYRKRTEQMTRYCYCCRGSGSRLRDSRIIRTVGGGGRVAVENDKCCHKTDATIGIRRYRR